MKKHYFLLLGAILVGGIVSQGLCGSEPGARIRSRSIFTPLQTGLLVVTPVENTVIAHKPAKQYAPGHIYYFVQESEPECSLLVYNRKQQALHLAVPRYKHRPITAKWINPKLLYLEMFFNPHYGAYWIFDVENETIVFQELQNDGADARRQTQAK